MIKRENIPSGKDPEVLSTVDNPAPNTGDGIIAQVQREKVIYGNEDIPRPPRMKPMEFRDADEEIVVTNLLLGEKRRLLVELEPNEKKMEQKLLEEIAVLSDDLDYYLKKKEKQQKELKMVENFKSENSVSDGNGDEDLSD